MKNKINAVNTVLDIFNNNYNKQVILYGPPGTSKTYSSTIIAAKFLSEDRTEQILEYDKALDKLQSDDIKERFKIVQFHPSYNYDDFVRGIEMELKESNGYSVPNYKVVDKIFGKFADEAFRHKNNKYLMIIDEINRAPLASVLGELIYGLENRGAPVNTQYMVEGNSQLIIPDNLYIIGTMNTADRSIGSIDYAIRRRFAFIPLTVDSTDIKSTWRNEEVGETAKQLFEKLICNDEETNSLFNSKYLADQDTDLEDIKIGQTYFMGKKKKEWEEVQEWEYLRYQLLYGVLPIYEEYIKDGLINEDNEIKSNLIEICTAKDNFQDNIKDFLKKKFGAAGSKQTTQRVPE